MSTVKTQQCNGWLYNWSVPFSDLTLQVNKLTQRCPNHSSAHLGKVGWLKMGTVVRMEISGGLDLRIYNSDGYINNFVTDISITKCHCLSTFPQAEQPWPGLGDGQSDGISAVIFHSQLMAPFERRGVGSRQSHQSVGWVGRRRWWIPTRAVGWAFDELATGKTFWSPFISAQLTCSWNWKKDHPWLRSSGCCVKVRCPWAREKWNLCKSSTASRYDGSAMWLLWAPRLLCSTRNKWMQCKLCDMMAPPLNSQIWIICQAASSHIFTLSVQLSDCHIFVLCPAQGQQSRRPDGSQANSGSRGCKGSCRIDLGSFPYNLLLAYCCESSDRVPNDVWWNLHTL